MVSYHKTCLICFTRTCQKREVNLFSKLGQGRTLMCVRGLLLVLVIWSAGLVNRKFHFGIGINQGTIPSGFPDIWVVVPGCSRNGSGKSPYLRVQKIVELWQSTQNTLLRPTKVMRQFLSVPPFYFHWHLGDVLFSYPRNECVVTGFS